MTLTLDLIITAVMTVVVALGAYTAALYILSHFSGWGELASRYRAAGLPAPQLRGRTVRMPMGGYNGCVHMAVDTHCLYLGMMPIFSPFHPPLAIPFSDIEIDAALGRAPSGTKALSIAGGTITLFLYQNDIEWIESRFTEQSIAQQQDKP